MCAPWQLSDENFSEDEAPRYEVPPVFLLLDDDMMIVGLMVDTCLIPCLQPRSRSPEQERISSPKSAMDMHMVFGTPKKSTPVDYSNDEFAEKR